MKKGLLIAIALLLCMAAVPYGTDLANVYVRTLDTRDIIYKGIGIPKPEFTDKVGGLSERTVIFGNLQIIPILMNDLDVLKKQAKAHEIKIKLLVKQVTALTRLSEPVAEPNEVKEVVE